MKWHQIILWVSCVVASQFAMSADPEIYSHKTRGAIKGVDPVAYFSLQPGDDAVEGDKNISWHYKGADWYFSSQANRELFMQNPEQYIPQYGGYCAYAVSQGSLVSVNPDYWHIIEGKLYLNYNYFADRKWRKDIEGYIDLANERWPSILQDCEEEGDCAAQ
jgi:YHS domain-containing protein